MKFIRRGGVRFCRFCTAWLFLAGHIPSLSVAAATVIAVNPGAVFRRPTRPAERRRKSTGARAGSADAPRVNGMFRGDGVAALPSPNEPAVPATSPSWADATAADGDVIVFGATRPTNAKGPAGGAADLGIEQKNLLALGPGGLPHQVRHGCRPARLGDCRRRTRRHALRCLRSAVSAGLPLVLLPEKGTRKSRGSSASAKFDVTEKAGPSPREAFFAWESRGTPEFLLWMARNRLNLWCVEQEGPPLHAEAGHTHGVRAARLPWRCFLHPELPYPYAHPRFPKNQGTKPRDPLRGQPAVPR